MASYRSPEAPAWHGNPGMVLEERRVMQRTRRNVLAGGTAAVGAAVPAACAWRPVGKPGEAPAGRALQPRKPVTLDFWCGPSSSQRQDQVAAWNAKYPDIQVN